MRKLYINCESGVSGDMMLGAFLNLGVRSEYLSRELERLNLDEFHIEALEKEHHSGKRVTDVDVVLKDKECEHIHPYSGKFRNYGDICEIIEKSSLSDNVKSISKKIFDIKASAEAKVHGISSKDVQFHEAGAVDSIVDIIGTAICCDYMDIDMIIAKEVPTGYGQVKCACGILPVPAPAVKQILEDTKIPNYRSDIPQEVLTPTGAAIISGITEQFGWEEVNGNVIRKGYGIGKRETGLPPLELILCEE